MNKAEFVHTWSVINNHSI